MILFTTSILFFCYYLYEYFHIYQSRERQIHMNNIIGIALVAEQSKANKLNERIEGVTHSNIKITFSSRPIYPLQFPNHVVTSILALFHSKYKFKKYIKISFSTGRDHWINLSLNRSTISFSRYLSTPVIITILGIIAQLIIIFMIISYYFSMQRYYAILNEIKCGADQIGLWINKDQWRPGRHSAKEAVATLSLIRMRVKELLVEKVSTLAGLSHDIKTPLTRIKLMVDLQKDDSSRKQQLLDEINTMEYLIAQTLSLAKSSVNNEEKITIDIVSLIETIIGEAKDRGNSINYSSALEKFVVLGQHCGLTRAFKNLIDNAIHYGGHVFVAISTDSDDTLIISVADDGPGIPTDELNKAFSPFFRGKSARKMHPGGFGLGLSIAKSAIEASGGSIKLTNKLPHGLIVNIRFFSK